MSSTTEFDEYNIEPMELNEIAGEEDIIEENVYNIQFCIKLARSKECNQKGSIYLYPFNSEIVNEYTIIPQTGKIDIEKFVTILTCLDSSITCSNSWKKDNKKEYFLSDLLFCSNAENTGDISNYIKIGNIYLATNCSNGKIKLIGSNFTKTLEYFNWELQLDSSRCFVYKSRSFFLQNNSIIYKNVLKKMDKFEHSLIPPIIISEILQNRALSTNYRKSTKREDFFSYFKKLPGYKFIRYSNITEYTLKLNDKSVEMLAWIPPWTKGFLPLIKFNEIDATFRSTRPYAGFSFTGILKNSGIPLIFILAPTESLKAYNFGLYCLKMYISEENINAPPLTRYILADRGTAIVSFCTNHNFFHYYCWRHLLESIGNTSKMIPILYYINDSQTQEELQARIQLVKTLITDDKYSGDKSIKKMEELLNCTEHWAKINRLVYEENGETIAIATSSNHQESQHKSFNFHSTKYSIELRLIQIFDDIKLRISNFISKPNRNAKNKLKDLAEIAQRIPSDLKSNECNCFEGHYYRYLFEIDQFPCVHTVDCSNLIITPQIGSDAKNNKYILPNDDQFRDIEECKANRLYEGTTNELWNSNNIENPKRSPVNYKIKDVPTMNLCDFGRSIMNPSDYEKFQKFYSFTLFMLKKKNINREDANLKLLHHLIKEAYGSEIFNDEFYFKLSLKIIETSKTSLSQNEEEEIYQLYLNYNPESSIQ